MFKILKTGLKLGIGFYIFKMWTLIVAMVSEINLMNDANLTNEEIGQRLLSKYPYLVEKIYKNGDLDKFITKERNIFNGFNKK